MHSLELPLRWVDIDALRHVNNVAYLEFTAEAVYDLECEGTLPHGVQFSRIEVDYATPLTLDAGKIRVDSELIDHTTLRQTVRSAASDTVNATVASTRGEAVLRPQTPWAISRPFDCRIRRSDLGPHGTVTQGKVFELFEDARIAFADGLRMGVSGGGFVIVRVAVDFHAPIAGADAPLTVRSGVDRVGGSSFTVASALASAAGHCATCRSTYVALDPLSGRSQPLTDRQRQRLDETA